MARTVVIVPARMESVRLPGKPLADICGKPLIVRVLEGVAGAGTERLAVATDSRAVCRAVESAGFEAVLTEKARSGTERVFMAWKAMGRPGDRIVNLQGDEPGAGPGWVEALTGPEPLPDGVATLATPLPREKAGDPSKVKVVFDAGGRALYFSRCPIPWNAAAFHLHVGVYCFTPESLSFCAAAPAGTLAAAEDLEQLSWMEAGAGITVVPGQWNGMGVDTPEDLEEVRAWFARS